MTSNTTEPYTKKTGSDLAWTSADQSEKLKKLEKLVAAQSKLTTEKNSTNS